MTRYMISFFFLLCATHVSLGSHFRGGSMSWKPIGNNKIELTYHVSFRYDHTETRFEPCTPEAQRDRTVLRTSGEIHCESCLEEDREKDLTWICDDYDIDEDSSVGHNTVVYTIPEGHQVFDISHEHCCWVSLQSPINRDGSTRGWKMITHVDVRQRADGRNNSSPVTAPIPLEKFYKGCDYHLRIPVSDPDNDAIRCRYADTEKNECPVRSLSRACGPATDGLTINKKSCTMEFNTRNIEEGHHAVNVMIEDYLKPFRRKNKPLSKVPLLFLLYVDGESDTCLKPSFVDPPSCKTIRPGENFQLAIRADPGDPTKPISRIKTQKPFGMSVSGTVNDPSVSNRKMVYLYWTPTMADIGEHSVCYSALDSDSYTSGVYCTFLYVDDNPLRPDAENSQPASGEEIEIGQTWVVQFNKEIKRAKKTNARIKIVNPVTGQTAFQLNATDPEMVFADRRIEFVPPREALFSGATTRAIQYKLQLEEGVAMTKAGGCGSEATEWVVTVIDTNECDSSPCENGARCQDEVNGFSCQCEPGWEGSRCESNINECGINLCQNGGLCVDGINSFTCMCPPGWGGDVCQANEDECSSSPCVNGQCIDGDNSYTCNCDAGWTGTRCNEDVDECESSPCVNGQCEDGANHYHCECDADWTGTNCDVVIDDCASSPCINGACEDGINRYRCNCEPGWNGKNCQLNINECASDPCVNSQCEDGVNQYQCDCDPGWTGDNCDVNINECESSPCVNGRCDDGVNVYRCNCEAGWEGEICDQNIDECSSNPCVNGLCEDGISQYQCDCNPGWTGDNCDINVNECESSPCVNGQCEDGANHYHCECDAGWSGDICDTNLDECASGPCVNGLCQDGINQYQCNCDSGWTGDICDVNIDECASNPCLNGGTCVDEVNGYTCECQLDWSGVRCEHDSLAALPRPTDDARMRDRENFNCIMSTVEIVIPNTIGAEGEDCFLHIMNTDLGFRSPGDGASVPYMLCCPSTCGSECYTDQSGLNYRGQVARTSSGKTCQKWTAQSPHRHNRTPENHPDAGLGDHNYCRNPDENPSGPWCYTTDEERRAELCYVGNPSATCGLDTSAGPPAPAGPPGIEIQ